MVALLASYPLVLAGLVSNVFYALNRQLLQLILLGSSALIGYGTGTVAVAMHPSLVAACAGALVGFVSYYVSLLLVGYVVDGRKASAAISLLYVSIRPMAIALLALFACRLALRPLGPDTSIRRAIIAEFAFCLLMTPTFLGVWRDLRRK